MLTDETELFNVSSAPASSSTPASEGTSTTALRRPSSDTDAPSAARHQPPKHPRSFPSRQLSASLRTIQAAGARRGNLTTLKTPRHRRSAGMLKTFCQTIHKVPFLFRHRTLPAFYTTLPKKHRPCQRAHHCDRSLDSTTRASRRVHTLLLERTRRLGRSMPRSTSQSRPLIDWTLPCLMVMSLVGDVDRWMKHCSA